MGEELFAASAYIGREPSPARDDRGAGLGQGARGRDHRDRARALRARDIPNWSRPQDVMSANSRVRSGPLDPDVPS